MGAGAVGRLVVLGRRSQDERHAVAPLRHRNRGPVWPERAPGCRRCSALAQRDRPPSGRRAVGGPVRTRAPTAGGRRAPATGAAAFGHRVDTGRLRLGDRRHRSGQPLRTAGTAHTTAGVCRCLKDASVPAHDAPLIRPLPGRGGEGPPAGHQARFVRRGNAAGLVFVARKGRVGLADLAGGRSRGRVAGKVGDPNGRARPGRPADGTDACPGGRASRRSWRRSAAGRTGSRSHTRGRGIAGADRRRHRARMGPSVARPGMRGIVRPVVRPRLWRVLQLVLRRHTRVVAADRVVDTLFRDHRSAPEQRCRVRAGFFRPDWRSAMACHFASSGPPAAGRLERAPGKPSFRNNVGGPRAGGWRQRPANTDGKSRKPCTMRTMTHVSGSKAIR